MVKHKYINQHRYVLSNILHDQLLPQLPVIYIQLYETYRNNLEFYFVHLIL